jgi:hypothetical protein
MQINHRTYLFTSGVRGFAAKDFIWRAFIFYAHPRVKNERTPKYYFPGRTLLNSYGLNYYLARSAEKHFLPPPQ